MRAELGGKGDPRDEFALEGSGVDTSGGAPIVLEMANGEVFHPEDYISLGYTHVEVWCVGACGGRGGDAYPQNYNFGGYVHGGGGGGGGLHRVTVELADLPADCPVVVGQAGTDGLVDNGERPYLYNLDSNGYIAIPSSMYQNPAWGLATDGTDGGASSFAGDICRASGGKGGKAIKTVVTLSGATEPKLIIVRRAGGDGGAGGRGASIVAGGGGAGGRSEPIVKPKDGAWDGTIGEGGGGGLGGYVRIVYTPELLMSV